MLELTCFTCTMTENTRAELERLLQLRNEHPDQASTIDAEIYATFAQTHSILVLDLSGFSRLTIRYSIIHFLAMVRRLCAIAQPLIQQHQGRVVKQEADNLYAVFPDVDAAIAAAIDILKGLAAVNTTLPDSQDLYACIGIGYGEVLMIEGRDMYGSEMNLASKLGEDLARPGEILVTEVAYQQMEDPSCHTWEKLEFSVSGMSLDTYKVVLPVPLLG
jgi:class 3 adenylate cyclase